MTETELIARLERLERENRRLKRVFIAVTVGAVVVFGMCWATSTRSEQAGNQASPGCLERKHVLSALKDAEYAFRRFQEVTSEVNFSGWNAGHGLVDALQLNLERALRVSRDRVALIDSLQAEKSISGSDLFDVYDGLAYVQGSASGLASDIAQYKPRDTALATDLTHVSTLAIETGAPLRSLVRAQILAEESELDACRAKAR